MKKIYCDLVRDCARFLEEKALISKRRIIPKEKESPKIPAPSLRLEPLKPKAVKASPPPAEPKVEAAPKSIENLLPPKKNEVNEERSLFSSKLRTIVEQCSEMAVVEKIPSDAAAKRRARLWMHRDFTKEIVVVRHGKDLQENTFLDNLWKAVDERIKPAEIVDGAAMEGQKLWEQLLAASSVHWILCPSQALMDFPLLRAHFREDPETKQKFLAHIPLLLLPALPAFLNNPAKKRELWDRLCQTLNGSQKSSSIVP